MSLVSILPLFLMVLGLVMFFLVMVGVPSPPRLNFLGAGLFCWLLAEMLIKAPLH